MRAKVSERRYWAAEPKTADEAADLFRVLKPDVPAGMEHVGWTWEYRDGSWGVVKPGERIQHRWPPVNMRPVFARA